MALQSVTIRASSAAASVIVRALFVANWTNPPADHRQSTRTQHQGNRPALAPSAGSVERAAHHRHMPWVYPRAVSPTYTSDSRNGGEVPTNIITSVVRHAARDGLITGSACWCVSMMMRCGDVTRFVPPHLQPVGHVAKRAFLVGSPSEFMAMR